MLIFRSVQWMDRWRHVFTLLLRQWTFHDGICHPNPFLDPDAFDFLLDLLLLLHLLRYRCCQSSNTAQWGRPAQHWSHRSQGCSLKILLIPFHSKNQNEIHSTLYVKSHFNQAIRSKDRLDYSWLLLAKLGLARGRLIVSIWTKTKAKPKVVKLLRKPKNH